MPYSCGQLHNGMENVCMLSKEDTLLLTREEVKRLQCEQLNWGMTAANTPSTSCCEIQIGNIHTDIHLVAYTHKKRYLQSWPSNDPNRNSHDPL